jgi:hypothetical protein
MSTADLYEQDFYAWVEKNAALIQEGRTAELDFEHIADELEELMGNTRREIVSATARAAGAPA